MKNLGGLHDESLKERCFFWRLVVAVMNGALYVVATPIGNLADISARALEILAQVDLIAAEDTRHSRRLLQHYHIRTPCVPYHDHNEQRATAQLLERLQQGQSLALISDAGTPLINDPGYRLTVEAHRHRIPVVPVAGPCALIAALSVSGLPTDRFVFEGFLASRASARRARINALIDEPRTIVFYASPHQVTDSFADLCEIFGRQRRACLAREISKRFETIRSGNLGELQDFIQADDNQQKGEFVICLAGAEEHQEDNRESRRILAILLANAPLSQAVAMARKITGEPRNKLYTLAMQLTDEASPST